MSPLFGPILAQLVTLGVADRTEARYVVSDQRYAEIATYPSVRLNIGWKHAALNIAYGPSITVTPLEAKDPFVLVFHAGQATVSNRWQRTTAFASEALAYGRIDLREQALANPGSGPTTTITTDQNGMMMNGGNGRPAGSTGTGTTPPTPPVNGTSALPALDQPITFASSVTTVGVSQFVSTVLVLTGGVFYTVSSQLGTHSGEMEVYPTVRGPGAQSTATYRPSHYDGFTTSVTTQLATSSGGGAGADGNHAWYLFANETWSHQFDLRTVSTLGAGLSITRNSQQLNGLLVYYSIFPNFVAGINHFSLLGRSVISFGSSLSSTPYVNPLSGSVDPRLSAAAYVSWHKDRFSSSLVGGAAVSLATGGDQGAFDTVNGALNLNYRLGAGFSIDTGIRTAWQTVGGNAGNAQGIPLSAAAYAAITVAEQVPSNGR